MRTRRVGHGKVQRGTDRIKSHGRPCTRGGVACPRSGSIRIQFRGGAIRWVNPAGSRGPLRPAGIRPASTDAVDASPLAVHAWSGVGQLPTAVGRRPYRGSNIDRCDPQRATHDRRKGSVARGQGRPLPLRSPGQTGRVVLGHHIVAVGQAPAGAQQIVGDASAGATPDPVTELRLGLDNARRARDKLTARGVGVERTAA
jgi:hypothetical protein